MTLEEDLEVVEGGYADHIKDDFDLQNRIIEKRRDDRHELSFDEPALPPKR